MAKQDDWTRITLRLPDDLHRQLTGAAGAASLNAEIVRRLEVSFEVEPAQSPDAVRGRIFADGADNREAPSPEDVLSAELQKALRQAVASTLDNLQTAGFMTMLYDVDALAEGKEGGSFHKPAKRHSAALAAARKGEAK